MRRRQIFRISYHSHSHYLITADVQFHRSLIFFYTLSIENNKIYSVRDVTKFRINNYKL